MAYCEDFPACGHEMGCCPDYDDDGQQMNMRCTCGARIPVTSRFSLCESCMNAEEIEPGVWRPRTPEMLDDDEHWVGGYGADENWQIAYWRRRAGEAEARLEEAESGTSPHPQTNPPVAKCECGDDDCGGFEWGCEYY